MGKLLQVTGDEEAAAHLQEAWSIYHSLIPKDGRTLKELTDADFDSLVSFSSRAGNRRESMCLFPKTLPLLLLADKIKRIIRQFPISQILITRSQSRLALHQRLFVSGTEL